MSDERVQTERTASTVPILPHGHEASIDQVRKNSKGVRFCNHSLAGIRFRGSSPPVSVMGGEGPCVFATILGADQPQKAHGI